MQGKYGAYITDPAKLVNIVAQRSTYMAIGGDSGGGTLKLGITFQTKKRKSDFIPLVIIEGKDSWEELSTLASPGITPFVGDSVAWVHIFDFFQDRIDINKRMFLNGDWCFINAILGLKSPSATHPCPICIVDKAEFTSLCRLRSKHDMHSMKNPPLITIPSSRIVPTPLHVFLGVSNRIITDVYAGIFGKKAVGDAIAVVKSKHKPGNGGRADLFDLNGPEVRKWVKLKQCDTLRDVALDDPGIDREKLKTIPVLSGWLGKLSKLLLNAKPFNIKTLEAFKDLKIEVWNKWTEVTGQEPFPKIHMLGHAVEFYEKYQFLGLLAESQIESTHGKFNTLFNQSHANTSDKPAERLRRTLADGTLKAIQPMLA